MYIEYINRLKEYLDKTIYLNKQEIVSDYESAMQQVVSIFTRIKKSNRGVFFIGNGGSAAIASHMTADFMKNGGMNTCSLFDSALTTCMGNDYGYEHVFSKPLSFLIRENDLLVAVSSSGNSKSIVNAIEVAKEKKAVVITFSGFEATNRIKQLGDFNIYVPVIHYGMVESIHILILQQIVDTIQERDGAII